MPKPESNLRGRILRRLNDERPGYWVVNHGSAMQAAGRPDIEGCYKGRYVAFEVKTPANREGVTDLQAHTLKVIARAGGVSGVITSPEEALALIPI